MAVLLNRLTLNQLVKVNVRYKNGPNHWATLRKKKQAKDKALEHFDEFYGAVYGDSWEGIRTAMLMKRHKYMAIANNFSESEKVCKNLESQGAMHLKAIYDVFREHMKERQEYPFDGEEEGDKSPTIHHQMDAFLSSMQASEVGSVYPGGYNDSPESLNITVSAETPVEKHKLEEVRLTSIQSDLNEVDIDATRIITSGQNLSGLHEFVPASKIKGMDDFVLESEYYRQYTQDADFSVNVIKESNLSFPEHLHIYVFQDENESTFRPPKRGLTGVLDYFLFDGASILPVLALDIQPGDFVLDMCAAPGGKSLAILQTLMPQVLTCNDIMESRVNRINKVLTEYVAGIGEWDDKLFVTQHDARHIEDKNVYDKILVDVPCTTDRHVLHNDENNLFKSTRVKERLAIPQLQTAILTNALKLVKVGGTVVYSTCTLSPVQNDGVVQSALKRVWDESEAEMVVKDISPALAPLEILYKFADIGLKYGHVVVPTATNNWGPMYFCKIQRTK